jgi:hypothetical protein
MPRNALAYAAVCAVLTLGAGQAAATVPSSSNLIVLDRSIGGVSLREQRSAVDRQVGRGVVVSSKLDRSARPAPVRVERVSYMSGALIVTYVSEAKQQPVAVILQSVSPRFRTRSGVGVGSTFASLRSIGGVKCYAPASTECQHGYRLLNGPGTTFRLDRPHGKVVYVAMAFGH